MQPWDLLLIHLPSGKHLTFHCTISIFKVLLSQVSQQLSGESQQPSAAHPALAAADMPPQAA